MMTFIELAPVPNDPPEPFTDRLRLAVAAYLAASRPPPASTLNLTGAATCPGAPSTAWTRWPRSGRTSSSTSGGCKRSAGSSPPLSPAGSPSRPGSTGPSFWMASSSTRPPSTSAAPRCPRSHPPSGSPTCSSRPCSPSGTLRTRATSRWSPCSACWACGSSKLPARTSPTLARSTATGCCACAARAPRSSWCRCPQRSAGLARLVPMSERALCGVAWHRRTPVLLRWRQEVSP
jgi:hypothetical protein